MIVKHIQNQLTLSNTNLLMQAVSTYVLICQKSKKLFIKCHNRLVYSESSRLNHKYFCINFFLIFQVVRIDQQSRDQPEFYKLCYFINHPRLTYGAFTNDVTHNGRSFDTPLYQQKCLKPKYLSHGDQPPPHISVMSFMNGPFYIPKLIPLLMPETFRVVSQH